MDPKQPRESQGKSNVIYLADVVAARAFAACEGVQKIWVFRARDGSLRLSFVPPSGAKKPFVPETLEGFQVELLAIGSDGEEHRVHATLRTVHAVSVTVPGLPRLDETRVQAALVLSTPSDASCLWFEANEGDASNVARIVLIGPEKEQLAWANARFPSIAVAPPPPSRRCM